MYDRYALMPETVANLTGVDQLAQRELRRRGLIDAYGECRNSRWYYSLEDAVGFRAGDFLAGHGFSREEAYTFTRRNAVFIVNLATGKVSPYRFAAYGRDGGPLQDEQMAKSMGDLSPRLSLRVIDLAALVEKIPTDLRDVLRNVPKMLA